MDIYPKTGATLNGKSLIGICHRDICSDYNIGRGLYQIIKTP